MLAPVEGMIAVIPAYNEAQFIGSVVLKAAQYVETVIVVDDGSTDCTAEIATLAGALVVRHTINQGKGIALNSGFAKARELNASVVITIDGDWQHLPEEMSVVAAPVLHGEADIVVGSRYLAHTSDVPLQRALGHQGFTTLTNRLSGTYLTDSQSGFRAFSALAVETLSFRSRSFSVESEMQFLAADYHLRVVEVPITIRYHTKPKRLVFTHGLIVLNGLLSLVSERRPLLFFGIPGVVSLVLGLLLGIRVVYNFNLYQKLATGTTLMVVIFILSGIFFMFTSIVLHAIQQLRLELKGTQE